MASGIIIHITVGSEKRTEFFTEERIAIGSDDTNDLQIHTSALNGAGKGVWLELENSDGFYRIIEFDPALDLQVNDHRIRRFVAITDGDRISIPGADISFTFFSLAGRSALITTNRETPVAQFIEEAALEARTSPKRDDAKAFLREFSRELLREVSWTTKAIIFVLAAAFIYGLVYVGYSVSRELRESRETTQQQSDIIRKLEEQLGQTSDQLGSLEKANSDLLNTVSLGRNMRVAYGNGVCLIVGVYDLVDRKSGKVLRYPDPSMQAPTQYEPAPSEDSPAPQQAPSSTLTTEGGGSPVEYDFIGTGFHVGQGYVVTNRHVVHPWTEDDNVKQMLRDNNGRPRVKRLVAYFPNLPQPFSLKIVNVGSREDLAVGQVDKDALPDDVPALPLDTGSEAVAIGRTVVTMGYPSGPDRLLAMVDDDEAKSINQRFGNSRQNLINFLAQSKKILPLTTQGAITDLDDRRIVHDAKTAEGGSGAPLFGQSGKVIGVNFGVFTENTAANMAIPVRYAIELLGRSGWKSPEQLQQESLQMANANSSVSTRGGTQ